MKSSNILIVFTISLLLSFSSVISLAEGNHKYLGVKTCLMCHRGESKGAIFEKWKNSSHAKAFETLSSPQSIKIAKEKKIKGPANQAKECLTCHATAYGIEPAVVSEKGKMDLADGVQCEECHGAGADYLAVHQKDKAKAQQNGLIVKKDEKACIKCHNKNSPTYKPFKMNEAWAKIAHPLPKK